MAYDRDLADRIRVALTGRDVREVKMFGGLSFMVDGKLAVAADTTGNLMVRVAEERSAELIATTEAVEGEMKGRKMGPSWLVVPAAGVDVEFWVGLALERLRAA